MSFKGRIVRAEIADGLRDASGVLIHGVAPEGLREASDCLVCGIELAVVEHSHSRCRARVVRRNLLQAIYASRRAEGA